MNLESGFEIGIEIRKWTGEMGCYLQVGSTLRSTLPLHPKL